MRVDGRILCGHLVADLWTLTFWLKQWTFSIGPTKSETEFLQRGRCNQEIVPMGSLVLQRVFFFPGEAEYRAEARDFSTKGGLGLREKQDNALSTTKLDQLYKRR